MDGREPTWERGEGTAIYKTRREAKEETNCVNTLTSDHKGPLFEPPVWGTLLWFLSKPVQGQALPPCTTGILVLIRGWTLLLGKPCHYSSEDGRGKKLKSEQVKALKGRWQCVSASYGPEKKLKRGILKEEKKETLWRISKLISSLKVHS